MRGHFAGLSCREDQFARPLKAGPAWGRLTAREREAADLLGRRLSNKEIAERLGVSPSTVKTHVKRIFEKLNIHDRLEISAFQDVEPAEQRRQKGV